MRSRSPSDAMKRFTTGLAQSFDMSHIEEDVLTLKCKPHFGDANPLAFVNQDHIFELADRDKIIGKEKTITHQVRYHRDISTYTYSYHRASTN
jgi:hypothetical protein